MVVDVVVKVSVVIDVVTLSCVSTLKKVSIDTLVTSIVGPGVSMV